MAGFSKYEIVTEAAKWLSEWLATADPDFKECSLLIITVSKGEGDKTIFDMASNEPPEMMGLMLAHGLEQALTSTPDHVEIVLPKATQ